MIKLMFFYPKLCLPVTNASNESGLTCLNCHRGAHEGVKKDLEVAWIIVERSPLYQKAKPLLMIFHSFDKKVAKTQFT